MGWDFAIRPLAALAGFSSKKLYGRFAGTKQSGRNDEVGAWWGSTVSISPKFHYNKLGELSLQNLSVQHKKPDVQDSYNQHASFHIRSAKQTHKKQLKNKIVYHVLKINLIYFH